MQTRQEHIGKATIGALHEQATQSYRKCGEASVLNPRVPPVARIAALVESLGLVGAALYDGREALYDALVGVGSVAACWGQCWNGEGWPTDPDGPELRVLTEDTVADLQYVARLCARPGSDDCQLRSDLPVSQRLALLGVDLGKVSGWLVRQPFEPTPRARAVWLSSVHGALIHLSAGALTWAHYLEATDVHRPR